MKNFLEKETFSRLIFRMLDDTLLIRNGFHAQINLQRLLNDLNGIDRRRSTHNNKNNVCSLGVCRHVGRQRGIANKNLSLVSSDRDIRMTLPRARPCFPRTSLLSITSVFPPRKYLLPVSRISSNTRSTLETTNSSGGNRDAIKRWKISSSHVCHALLYRREINENFYFFINVYLPLHLLVLIRRFSYASRQFAFSQGRPRSKRISNSNLGSLIYERKACRGI